MSRSTVNLLIVRIIVVVASLVVLLSVTLQSPDRERVTGGGIVPVAVISQSARTVGISDNDLYFSAGTPATISRHISAITALGVKNIRLAIPWATVETADGQYYWTAIDNMVNAAAGKGMGILGVVNTTPAWARPQNTSVYTVPTRPSDYGDFMRAVALRYKGKVSAYEVWNEPNGILGYQPTPDPVGYTALLKAAYPAIKAVDSSATVIGGVLGSVISFGSWSINPVDFVQQMYSAGAAGKFDALSFHPYQNTTKFSQGASLANSPVNQLTSIRQLMAGNGDSAKKIWASEYGLATSVVGDQQQSDFISDFLIAWRKLTYAGPAFVYTLVDRNSADTNDPESTFGVYRDNWTQKPSAVVVKNVVAGAV